MMAISRALAETRLRKRYRQQMLRFPLLPKDISLETYIQRNVKHVMGNDLLADYDREPNWHPEIS
jgi:hypothetical protein